MPADIIGVDSTALTAKLFRGFGDPSRLSILRALVEGPLTVGDVVETTDLNQPNVSNHLRCLADCGLVVSERDGRFVRYELADPRVAVLIDLAEQLLSDVARGVEACDRYEDEAVDRSLIALGGARDEAAQTR